MLVRKIAYFSTFSSREQEASYQKSCKREKKKHKRFLLQGMCLTLNL